jgi:multidrug resistance efflux pump
MLNIKAPFDGYIVNKFFQEGDIAAPGHPIAIIENFNGFKVMLLFPPVILIVLKRGYCKVSWMN